MSTAIVPASKPRISSTALRNLIAAYNIDRDKYPFVIVGLRGYYLDSLGKKGKNDRDLYDDAIFIDSPTVTAAFNANTDPSVYRPGRGRGDGKGIAVLNEGAWFVHTFDKHNGKYLALCQRKGQVSVTRDGAPDYVDVGMFGINIHKGSFTTTSSLACQTIYPTQWKSFITLAADQAKRYNGSGWKEATIPYVLIKQQG